MRTILILPLLLFSIFCFATTDNIAPKAKIEASTVLNNNAAKNVADGIIGVDGIGEWVSDGYETSWGMLLLPWIQLTWEQPQIINRIVLYDRATLQYNIAGGKLLFSDGSVVWVNQLPKDGAGKEINFPSKKITWLKFEATDATGKELGLSEIEVFTAPEGAKDKVALVDPYIETNRGRYIFFITGSLPFGMASSAPLTRNKNQYGGGYNYNEPEILGFEQIHSWMMSGIEIMPATTKESVKDGQQGWKAKFNHDDEIVQPGYHRVSLQDNKIWVEQTVTERVNFYRFRYTQDADARIIINLHGKTSNAVMKNAVITKVSDTEIQGSVSTVDRFWGGPKDVKVFFVIQFDKPFDLKAWKNDDLKNNITSIDGEKIVLGADYKLKKNDVVRMKIAISYTTIENARKNLQTELAHWDFDKVRNDARTIWNNELSKIEVSGASIAQRIKFYTDLWHVLLGRQKINDVSGDYPDRTEGNVENKFTDAVFKIKTLPKKSDGHLKFNMYNSDAWWLTQWNLNVLWGLAWPEVMDEMSASMIEYANNGGLLPRGPCGGGYSYIMTSCPATNLITSTFQKGLLTKADPNHAFEIIKKNHMPGGMLGPKEEIEFYIKNGWWPNNVGIGIEATFQDWGAAQMAYKLNLMDDYKYFMNRSKNWQKNFDTETKLLLPLDEKGKFIHKDPLNGAGWVEANAWQGTWGVSHDLPKLIQLMGGKEMFCKKLNYAFEQAAPTDFVFAYSGGYVSYANQPGCSNAHVFSYGGKPWLTQYWVRRVQHQAYGGITPDLGYGGHDEDQGQMGGVSALMAIGLFNIQGNQSVYPVYEITSPIFDEIKIKLNKDYYPGNSFIIKAYNNNEKNTYIRSAKLNGKTWSKFWFSHDDFKKGGVLELSLDSKPNKSWGISELPPNKVN